MNHLQTGTAMSGVRSQHVFLVIQFAYFFACRTSQAQVLRSIVSYKHCQNDTLLVIHYRNTSRVDYQLCPPKYYCDREKLQCIEGPPLRDFECPASFGSYPDLRNCSKFLVCANRLPYSFECPQGQVYEQTSNKCVTGTDCNNFNCTGKFGANTRHVTDKRLYAVCKDEQPIALNHCGSGYEFKEELDKCEFLCEGIGAIVDVDKPQIYYTCKTNGTAILKETHRCRPGMTYCAPKKECIDIKKGKCN